MFCVKGLFGVQFRKGAMTSYDSRDARGLLLRLHALILWVRTHINGRTVYVAIAVG